MKKLIVLMIAASLLSHASYSQTISVPAPMLREINKALVKGREYKSLAELRQRTIEMQDEIISDQADVIVELRKQVMALEENYDLASQRASETASQLNAALYRTEQLAERLNQLKRARNTWRTISLGLAAALGFSLSLK